MNKKIKVTVEYWGDWSGSKLNQYKVVKIVGAVTFPYRNGAEQLVSVNTPPMTGRVGDLLNEPHLQNLASNIEVTVLPRS